MIKATLLHNPSSLEFLPNLSRHLGPNIYIKRDDEGGRGGGGNKLRKYEYLIGDALQKNCDTLIIAGHLQSNAARELVGAACQLNLTSVVVCKDLIPEQNPSFNQNGNALLMKLMNAEIVTIDTHQDFQEEMERISTQLSAQGKKPYIIPFGGSNALGSLGYVHCAHEILDQFNDIGNPPPTHVITPLGSGGTMAGLVAGFAMAKTSVTTLGFSVLHKDKSHIEGIVTGLISGIFNHLDHSNDNVHFEINTNHVGEGYGIPTKEGIQAIKTMAELEGLFLCPVYTSKALSGLIHTIKSNAITHKDTVVFIHTGGMPLVHSYYDSYDS